MFSESFRFPVQSDWINNSYLDLQAIGRQFFETANGGELPCEIEMVLGATKSHKVHHSFSAGRNRWIARGDAFSRFYSEVNLSQYDELIVRRVRPDKFRITPSWRPFEFIDLFAGIGGIRLAFEAVGGTCIFSSELDELAQDTYEANFGERPAGDISEISVDDIPIHDLLVAGFPCQPFSIIGNQKGFTDIRGTLFFHIERILRSRRPYAVMLENVKQFRTHDKGRTCETVMNSLKRLGYFPHIEVLNALEFGVAQKRERTFIVAFQDDIEFSFPQPYYWQPSLDSVLESERDVSHKLIASEMIQRKRLERLAAQGREPFYPSIWHENKGGHIGMHPFSCALRNNASYNYLLVNGMRRPTRREMLRLQGYPESFKIVVKHSAIRAQCGNSVAVPVVSAIAAKMILAMRLAIPREDSVRRNRQRSLFAPEILSSEQAIS